MNLKIKTMIKVFNFSFCRIPVFFHLVTGIDFTSLVMIIRLKVAPPMAERAASFFLIIVLCPLTCLEYTFLGNIIATFQ